jgi:hypothetical protein
MVWFITNAPLTLSVATVHMNSDGFETCRRKQAPSHHRWICKKPILNDRLFAGMMDNAMGQEMSVNMTILIGPILAIQIQAYIEKRRESRNRKISLFSTLIATRATRLAADHVRALNMIDIVFIDDSEIIRLWREYHDSLMQVNSQRDDLFIDLLHAIGRHLNFNFDKVMLRRVFYVPQAHVDAETAQVEIRDSMQKMFSGQQEIQKGLLQYLNGQKSLKISIDKGKAL